MTMRNVGWFALAVMMTGGLGTVAQAEMGLNQRTLDQMGLSGLSMMSDEAGLTVRGHGYTGAYGYSWAAVASRGATAGSVNGYYAKGSKYSSGENYSDAGIIIKNSGGHGGGYGDKSYDGGGGGCHSCGSSKSIYAFSGGGSTGKRK